MHKEEVHLGEEMKTKKVWRWAGNICFCPRSKRSTAPFLCRRLDSDKLMRVQHYVHHTCIFVCECVCAYIHTILFSSDCNKTIPPPQATELTAMLQTQGRKAYNEKTQLLEEWTEHFRAKKVVSDAINSHWRSGSFWEQFGTWTWPHFKYMSQKNSFLVPVCTRGASIFQEYIKKELFGEWKILKFLRSL